MSFQDNWGFLVEEDDPDAEKNYSSKVVKYFNPRGGTWTVKRKRLPTGGAAKDEAGLRKTAAQGSADNSHNKGMASLPENVTFLTTSQRYGARYTLEQFGISDYGRKATRTLDPSN